LNWYRDWSAANGEVWAAPEPLAASAWRNLGKGKHRRSLGRIDAEWSILVNNHLDNRLNTVRVLGGRRKA
jgi:hypothetical protein